MIYQNVVTGIMLIFCMLEDLADRRIRSSSLLLYGALAAAGKLSDIAAGTIPGIVCLVLSWMSNQALGYGDSLFILICGISLGSVQTSMLVMTAFLLSGIWSAVHLMTGTTERNKEIPFFPFLFAGWMISLISVR